MKERTELHTFSKEQILEICSFVARMQIVGSMFVGTIGEPIAKFMDDGPNESYSRIARRICQQSKVETGISARLVS